MTATRFVRRWVAPLATAGALAIGGLLSSVAHAQEEITIEFVTWNYSIDTIKDNIKKFEAENPGIKVEHTVYPWVQYHDTIVLRMRGKTSTDVLYVGEDWLAEWATAGWLASLEEHFPDDAGKYKDKVTQYALRDMTFGGKLYGLPYYSDMFTFMYNKALLDEHGIPVPETWDDVLAAALKLKEEAGIERPFVYGSDPQSPDFYQTFVSTVYGRGGRMFDDELNPVFNDPNSEAFKQLQWLQDAFTKHEIAIGEPNAFQIPVALNAGSAAMTVTWNYLLAQANDKATGARAGDFGIAPMPGASHEALGFAKFYAMTDQAAQDPKRREAAWKFIEYMGGGDYEIAKRWAVENGLGFAQLPLFDDPDVQASWSNWIDMEDFKHQANLALNGTQTEWTGVWSAFFRPLLAKAIVGDASVEEVMDAGAEKWLEFRELLRGS
ncbi:MAG: ABC transporter substrate-binding protein [Alphaproteobacteria bacterium]